MFLKSNQQENQITLFKNLKNLLMFYYGNVTGKLILECINTKCNVN